MKVIQGSKIAILDFFTSKCLLTNFCTALVEHTDTDGKCTWFDGTLNLCKKGWILGNFGGLHHLFCPVLLLRQWVRGWYACIGEKLSLLCFFSFSVAAWLLRTYARCTYPKPVASLQNIGSRTGNTVLRRIYLVSAWWNQKQLMDSVSFVQYTGVQWIVFQYLACDLKLFYW